MVADTILMTFPKVAWKYHVNWCFLAKKVQLAKYKSSSRKLLLQVCALPVPVTVHLNKTAHLNQPRRKKFKGWVQLDRTVLSQTEKDQLCNGEWLTDSHVNYAHVLLKKQFPHIDGLKNTLLIQKKQEIKRDVQIVHTQGNHWIVASSLRCSESEIEIFDSLYT